MSANTILSQPQIQAVHFANGNIQIDLRDGRMVSAPLTWFPRLQTASVAQRANYYVDDMGTGAHWPEVDEDISVRVLLGWPS